MPVTAFSIIEYDSRIVACQSHRLLRVHYAAVLVDSLIDRCLFPSTQTATKKRHTCTTHSCYRCRLRQHRGDAHFHFVMLTNIVTCVRMCSTDMHSKLGPILSRACNEY